MAVRPLTSHKRSKWDGKPLGGKMSFWGTDCVVNLEKVGKTSEMKDYFEVLPSLQCWTTDILSTLFPISTT